MKNNSSYKWSFNFGRYTIKWLKDYTPINNKLFKTSHLKYKVYNCKGSWIYYTKVYQYGHLEISKECKSMQGELFKKLLN